MKFNLEHALNGASIALQDGTPCERFFIDTDWFPAKIKVKVAGQVGLEIYNLDGSSESPKFYLTLLEPEREIFVVLFPNNEARYFYTEQAATAASGRSDCVGPIPLIVQLPWSPPEPPFAKSNPSR
jgi:hypothetical protein